MHPMLVRLVQADAALEKARMAVKIAEEYRRQCAFDLAKIENEEERTAAAAWAYTTFGKGLSLALAEAATGIPGRKSQAAFLVLCGRRQHEFSGSSVAGGSTTSVAPMMEWPKPSVLEEDVIRAHIAHGKPYRIDKGLGWTSLHLDLEPSEAELFLRDATAGIARAAGVTREELIEWLSSGGFVRCDATTKAGGRCQLGVAGAGQQSDLGKWKKAVDHGGYCMTHGG